MQQPASVLSDGTIRRLVDEGQIRIEPWNPIMVQPASVSGYIRDAGDPHRPLVSLCPSGHKADVA